MNQHSSMSTYHENMREKVEHTDGAIQVFTTPATSNLLHSTLPYVERRTENMYLVDFNEGPLFSNDGSWSDNCRPR